MRYFIKTEFIEYPCTIDLIGIGIVAEDGQEIYCISTDFDSTKASDWVKENVIAKLPKPEDCSLWMPYVQIRTEILHFIGDNVPEFWGYYADYDWVVFCWLFGAMVDLPEDWPLYCRDIKQLCDSLENPALLETVDGHNALAGAWWNKEAYESLTLTAEKGECNKVGELINGWEKVFNNRL
jgi:hypothetical protein